MTKTVYFFKILFKILSLMLKKFTVNFVVPLQMGFGAETFVANIALERSLSRVHEQMLLQI